MQYNSKTIPVRRPLAYRLGLVGAVLLLVTAYAVFAFGVYAWIHF